MLLTEDDVTQRSVSSFSDGTRLLLSDGSSSAPSAARTTPRSSAISGAWRFHGGTLFPAHPLQHGRLKIDASFFPTGTKSFGILSLSESTNVSLKRSKKGIFKSSSKDETFKDVSLGSFVMQPQDAVVGQADLLQALELELSSSDVSLWALANFTDPDSS
ncbi:hypothetical protein [Sporisorium scitamineum]|uniref:Uncharacterized protein n=1 Tax=Sporisorium scitamineum TaxID=49012 RepID=A0A0F7RSZ9_9BASI|nr:hypothetical protein [Sporisorium scitamineum]